MFNHKDGFIDLPVTVACGQCIGCRLERSRQWAIRCVHELQMHERASFITLTYTDANIPSGNTLHHPHFQRFLKRLRKKLYPHKIRYFMCGEYGSKYERPHYHACLYGWDFPDKELWQTRKGVQLYRSASLEKLWPFGYSTVGNVTFQSAAYVARYITKKITGPLAQAHYERLDETTGELFCIKPEYTTSSRQPAIGGAWYEKFSTDVYPSDFVVLNGKKMKPPRYYNGLYEITNPDEMLQIKKTRIHKAAKNAADTTPARLADREYCKQRQAEQLIRPLED